MTESNKACILIVDDERLNVSLLVSILKEQYDLKVATDGLQALQRVSTPPRPDMILLDIQMPGMDGYAVCKKLKETPDTAGIPVIFVTAMTEETDEQLGLELGAVDYVTKPFKPAIVKMRIKNHLTLKLQRDQLDRLATQDGLTEIANRRRFEEYLQQEWKRGLRTGAPLSLILLDIDHFKRFNDSHGHTTGDYCLQHVAKRLRHPLERATDLAARYGGEEFVCVLPDTSHDGALIIAEKVRLEIGAAPFIPPAGGTPLQVTASLGVATLIPAPQLSPLTLLETADKRLYEAKQAGRNRVVGGGG